MIQVVPQMAPGYPSVGRVMPLDLIESGQRIAQVQDIQVPIGVMMGEVPQRLPFRCGFDHCEGRIRKLFDVLPTPLRGIGRRSSHDKEANQYPESPSQSHSSSPSFPLVHHPFPRGGGRRPPVDLTHLICSDRFTLSPLIFSPSRSPAWQATMPFISLCVKTAAFA